MQKIGLENMKIEKEHISPEVIANISKKLVTMILSGIETELDNGRFLSYVNSEEFVNEALSLFDYIGSIPHNSDVIDFICEYRSTLMSERS